MADMCYLCEEYEAEEDVRVAEQDRPGCEQPVCKVHSVNVRGERYCRRCANDAE